MEQLGEEFSALLLLFFWLYIPVLLVYICLCDCVRRTAKRLNRNGIGWLFLSLFCTPILTAIMVHCLGKVEEDKEPKVNDFELTDAEKAHILNRRENEE
ncbi:hypothetical protein [Phocaeicola sp.]